MGIAQLLAAFGCFLLAGWAAQQARKVWYARIGLSVAPVYIRRVYEQDLINAFRWYVFVAIASAAAPFVRLLLYVWLGH
ncbi:MAG: hypothetical protein JRD89_00350 [Deltaproteobacteria bacterium]|nr:hypothetical protein [Deltaproteobacteria bacterium]